MMELSKRQTYQKVLINISTYLSFSLAYLIYDFGIVDAKGFGNFLLSFLVVGLMFYIVFEVISSCMYNFYYKFIPSFCLGRADFRLYMRVLVIFRNIVIALFNIIFIFFPVASVWGIKLVHILTTIATAVVGIKLLGDRINSEKYRYLYLTAIMVFGYLICYLFFGVMA